MSLKVNFSFHVGFLNSPQSQFFKSSLKKSRDVCFSFAVLVHRRSRRYFPHRAEQMTSKTKSSKKFKKLVDKVVHNAALSTKCFGNMTVKVVYLLLFLLTKSLSIFS